MVRGLCAKCGKPVGSILMSALQCPSCGKVFCEQCSPKVGSVFKAHVCPDCGVQLSRGTRRR